MTVVVTVTVLYSIVAPVSPTVGAVVVVGWTEDELEDEEEARAKRFIL